MAARSRVTNQLCGSARTGCQRPGGERRLLRGPGVREAVVVPEEGVAYLKVDSRDWIRQDCRPFAPGPEAAAL